MALSEYHLKQKNRTDELEQARAKKTELRLAFQTVPLETDSPTIRIAVMGCGDKRQVKHHREIFAKLLNRPVEITTFDLTIEHLEGEEGVVQHDCTLPLPNPPYDITMGHVLLRFIETDKQWNLIKNSYDALKSSGLALHVLDEPDYTTEGIRLPNGLFTAPLSLWEERLKSEGIDFQEVRTEFGKILVLRKS